MEKFMTATTPDVIIIRGQYYPLLATPLEPYIKRQPLRRRPDPAQISTSLRRGYIALWEIRDARLWLLDMRLVIMKDGEYAIGTLADAMPWLRPPVHASWFSDELICPEGGMRVYVHAGFASAYERDRLLDIDKGEVIRERLRLNPPLPVTFEIGADGGRLRRLDPLGHPGEDPRGDLTPGIEPPSALPYWAEDVEECAREEMRGGPAPDLWPPGEGYWGISRYRDARSGA
jgi:hypothetical protein